MILKFNRALLAGILLNAAGILHTQAQTLVTFSVDMATNIANGTFTNGVSVVAVRGTFDGFSAAGVTLAQEGSSSIYTNTFNVTNAVGTIMAFLFKDVTRNVHETRADGQNRGVRIPAGGSLVLGTPFFGDSGEKVLNNVTFQVDISQQIALGVFTNGVSQVSVRGTAIGWTDGKVLTNNPNILRTNQFGLVTSNVYVGTFTHTNSPWASLGYKFYLDNNATGPSHTPGYESVAAINQKAGGNRLLYMNSDVVLPVVDYGDAPYAPISQVRFSVDMSVVAVTDPTFNGSTLTINGGAMGWGGVTITNDPASANPNVYSGVFAMGAGTYTEYQYRYQGGSGTVYDHLNGGSGGAGNRFYTASTIASTNLPTVFFNDTAPTDVLLAPTPITFMVDMNGAVGTDAHAWVEGDSVVVNGPWPSWLAWNPIEMIDRYLVYIGSGIYSNTFTIPAGTPVGLTYKYGMNALDNEAGSGQNRSRAIRSTATGQYAFPLDKFGTQYNEPSFGQLSVGPASGGTVPLTWLGRPGVQVQTSSSLSGGSWVNHVETDGTNWTAGTVSTNGLLSTTNWPTSGGSLFFRLIKY